MLLWVFVLIHGNLCSSFFPLFIHVIFHIVSQKNLNLMVRFNFFLYQVHRCNVDCCRCWQRCGPRNNVLYIKEFYGELARVANNFKEINSRIQQKAEVMKVHCGPEVMMPSVGLVTKAEINISGSI